MKGNKGQWLPGFSGNPNGRPKGRKNAWTRQQKEKMRKAIGKTLDELEADLPNMRVESKWKTITALMKFVISTRQKLEGKIHTEWKIVEDDTDFDKKSQIEDDESNED